MENRDFKGWRPVALCFSDAYDEDHVDISLGLERDVHFFRAGLTSSLTQYGPQW